MWPLILRGTACLLWAGDYFSLTPVVWLPAPYFRLPQEVMTGSSMVLDERACCLTELSPFCLYLKQSWQVKKKNKKATVKQKLSYGNI